MPTFRRFLLVLALPLALAACDKGKRTKCEQYAEMEVRCGETNGEGVRAVAKQFCEAAQKDKDTEVLAAMIALEAECAQTNTECAAYQACIEKAKDEHAPPGM